MNKERLNTAIKTLDFTKDALYEVMNESVETKQVPDLPKTIAIEFAFMTAMLMGMETLLGAEMERCENNDKE